MTKPTKKSDDKRTIAKYNSVADFFTNASEKEQKNLLMKVAKQANEDQRKVLREYNKRFPK